MHTILENICFSPHSRRVIETLDEAGELTRLIPELTALKGRIQPPQYHPEGDAWIHTLLVVDQANLYGAYPHEVFAAMCHDLGKALTPADNLPHHYNHEILGVKPITEVCDRLNVPDTWRETAILCAKEHLNCHRFLELRPHKQVDLIDRCGMNVASLALVSMADARGRGPDFALKPYPSRDAIVRAAEAINGVTRETPQKTRDAKAKILKEIFHG